jgi:hypothetical protein
LAACGGGGGGSSSSASPDTSQSLKFTGLTSGSVNRTITDNSWGVYEKVSVAYTGTTTQPVVVVIEDADQMFSSASVESIANGIGVVSLGFSNKLKAGTYTSNFKIHACASSQIVNSTPPTATCVGEYPGSPVIVPRNVVIQALQLDKTSLNFSANGEIPAVNQIITYSGGQTQVPSALFGTTDSISGKVGISVNGKTITLYPLPVSVAGHYTGTLTITASGFKPQLIPVNYDVISPELAHGITLFPAFDEKSLNKTVSLNSSISQDVYFTWALNNPLTKVQSITVNYETASGWANEGFYIGGGTMYDLQLNGSNLKTAGLYRANVVITTNTSGKIDTYTTPISLTVQ